MYLLFALVHGDGKPPHAVVLCDVAPCQLADIAEPQANR